METSESVQKRPMVSFGEAVKTCLKKYFCFKGRARRSEFFWFWLFSILVLIIASILDSLFFNIRDAPLTYFALIALPMPLLSVTIRRLHDIDISGWGALWWFFPIWGGILVFTWFCKDSDIEKNEYGESPKYIIKLDDNS